MAQKKIIIAFSSQPQVGDYFRYIIQLPSQNLTYTNSLSELIANFGVGNNAPNQVGLGSDLNQTIDNVLAFLQSVWSANFNSIFLGTVTTNYERIGNTIHVTINTTAGNDASIRVWKLLGSGSCLRFETATPCNTAYFSNITAPFFNEVYSLTPPSEGIYLLVNQQTQQQFITAFPVGFDCEQPRGFSFLVLYQQNNTVLPRVIALYAFYQALTEQNISFVYNIGTLAINAQITPLPYYTLTPNIQFSIDGDNFQSSNLFEVAQGNYTVFVRDDYGCITAYEVNATSQPTVEPYHFISESNSIRYALRVEHGDCGIYKNRFNTLSCEENVDIAYKFTQLFQTCDAITTQVKTSYDNVEVIAGNQEIEATKIVANINLTDKRDCTYFNLDNGQLAIIFTVGNVYLYNTDDVLGQYQLNGNLPEWGVIGNIAETPYGNFNIANIFLLESGFRALVLNTTFQVSGQVSGQVQCLYNRDTFDTWEFTVNMNDYENQEFRVGVRFYNDTSTDLFPDVFYVSELISVKKRWHNTKEIIWRNSRNTDIYYFSGIQMKNRLRFCDVNTLSFEGDIENQKTDSQIISIDAVNYNKVMFDVDSVTTGIAAKLALALKHDFLVIEGVPYKLAENPSAERQGKSNFYRITAELLEAGDVFNQGTANTQVFFGNANLTGFLDTGDNEFIQI